MAHKRFLASSRLKRRRQRECIRPLFLLVPKYSSDAISNGIKVFKLSDRDGNLAKPNSLQAFHPPKFKTMKRIFIAIRIGTSIFALSLL